MTREEHWLLTEKYDGTQNEAFHADCARLKAGEPLAYVIGHTPFLNTTIWLDSHPLIPRVETEFWLSRCHQEMSQLNTSYAVLDLCAGSGAIGVATLKAFPDAAVDFAELDPTHEATIRKNLSVNEIAPTRSSIFIGDLFSPIPQGKRYHYILTNPPYIDESLGRTETSVTEHEPHLALFSAKDGLEHITRIVSQAATYLLPNGELWVEHEPEHTNAIKVIGQEHGFAVYTHQDQYNIERYSRLMLQ